MKISVRSKPKEKIYAVISADCGLVRIKAEITEGLMLRLKFAGIKITEKPLSSLGKEKETGKKEKEKKAALSLDLLLSLKGDFMRIIKEISFGHFHMKIRFGLDDSAETGMIYGYFMVLKSILYTRKRIVLEAYPDFDRFVFEPECDIEFIVKRVYRMFSPAFGIYKKVTGKKAKKAFGDA